MTAGWAEKQHLGDLPVFAQATLSDVQLFENFDEEAQLLLSHGETAKVRPQETSRWFTETADAVTAQISAADQRIGTHRSKEYASTLVDLKILAGLARYHSQRIPAAVSYRLYARTQDPHALDDAIAYERKATAAWHEMVDAAGDTYAPDLMFGARSRNLCGDWKDELTELEAGLAKLEAQRQQSATNTVSTPSPRYAGGIDTSAAPQIIHEPVASAPPLKPLTIRAKVSSPAGIKWVQVLYRSVDQTKDYETLAMQPVDNDGNYTAVIPADKLNPRFDFMYFIQAMDKNHHGVMYPDFNRQTPYFVVTLDRSE